MAWVGVDYGAKQAGTTVICYEKEGLLQFRQSEKKADADKFLASHLQELNPTRVYFDAPLSLPKVYSGQGEDYFYRACDKETKAMSPMFLGGLTARAMRLAASMPTIEFRETYPSYLIKNILGYQALYPKRSKYTPALAEQLAKDYNLAFSEPLNNWHQLDAMACYISGLRHERGEGITLGVKEEGLIYV